MSRRIDAVVVGMGASGAIVAAELAAAGASVVGLEGGASHDRSPITWRPGARDVATVLSSRVGSLAHRRGASWRMREADFRMRSAIVERFGVDAIPDNASIVDWPISYADLEPYYERVEREQGVSGRAGNIGGEIREGGNPFEAPRRRDFPMPPLQAGAGDRCFVEAARRLGFHPFPQPAVIASTDDVAAQRSVCSYCGFCHAHPCHPGARTSTRVSVPAALASGNLELRAFSRATRVLRDDRGRRVRGVAYVDGDGGSHELAADRVILACCAVENTRLLLASGIDADGNAGKYFMTHNYGWMTGTLPEYTSPFMGPATAASVVDDVNAERVPENDGGVVWGAAIVSHAGGIQPAQALGDVPPDPPRWGEGLRDWARESFRRLHSMYAQVSSLPDERFRIDLDPHVADRWGQPAVRITHDWVDYDARAVGVLQEVQRRIAREMGMTSVRQAPARPSYHVSGHEAGTHRMGDDPKRSVVDRHGEAHRCRGLYAIGGGQLPTNPGYDPTTTIMALAHLTAAHLCERGGPRTPLAVIDRTR